MSAAASSGAVPMMPFPDPEIDATPQIMKRQALSFVVVIGSGCLLPALAPAQGRLPGIEPGQPTAAQPTAGSQASSMLRGTVAPQQTRRPPFSEADRLITGSTVKAPAAPAADASKPAAVPAAMAAPATAEAIPALPASDPPASLPLAQRAPAPALSETGPMVYVVEQDLRAFLGDFARRMGLRADIAANVRGRLTKVKLPAEPMALLSELEKRHDIEWILEGELLKVSSRAELATRILPLGRITHEELVREMTAVGTDNSRYPLQKVGGSNAVIVTAPVQHVARIAALIETLKAGKSVGPDMKVIRAGVSQKVTFD
jgi:hypothetical protein